MRQREPKINPQKSLRSNPITLKKVPMEQFELPMDEAEGRIWSISDLTLRIKETLETFIGSCSVKGEIANFRKQSSGHLYFTLRDKNSQIAGVMFRSQARFLEFEPRDGIEVVLQGELTVYEPRGNYQLIVRSMQIMGRGSLQERLDVLKKKLYAEGLFNPERKQKLPNQIQNIGVITSPTGAALQDFLRIAKRREFSGNIWLYPSKVQGTGSTAELIQQIDLAIRHQKADVLVLTRGGGSLEDLWAFNEESLVRAIDKCSIPLISAVGHEIDFSLCDFVADLRMETPSGAAEWITSKQVAQRQKIEEGIAILHRNIILSLSEKQQQLEHQYRTWQRVSPVQRMNQLSQKIDDYEWRLQQQIKNTISKCTVKKLQFDSRLQLFSTQKMLDSKKLQINQLMKNLLKAQEYSLEILKLRHLTQKKRMENGSLQKTLKRVFCYVKTPNNEVLTKTSQIKKNVTYQLVLQDGQRTFKAQNDLNK